MSGVVALIVATAFLFWPMAWGVLGGTAMFFEWDVPEQYWPDLVYLCDALHDGTLPYWNPYDRAGYPYYADPQAGMYHPLNWGICLAAGPSPGPGWAQARVPLMFFLSGLFALLWLRRLRVPWSGAILGALVVEAAPFMRHNWELNLTTALAWMPLMLWAAERAVVERRAQDGIVVALAIALCGWVGSPPALWFACTFTLFYSLVRLWMEWRLHGAKIWPGTVKATAVGGAATVGLLGAVLMPGLSLAAHSVQQGRSLESIADGALDMDGLWALLSPQPGNHLYVGWTVLCLSLLGLLLHHRRRALSATLLLVAGAAVCLALGTQGPLFEHAFDWIPGVSLFRLPHRYEAWLGPAFAAGAAVGIGALSEIKFNAEWRWRLRPLAGGSFVMGASFAVIGAWTAALFFVSMMVLFVGMIERSWLRSPLFGCLLGALFVADVSQAMPADRHMRAGPHPGGADVATRVLAEAPDTHERFRYMDEFGVSCRSGTRYRRRDFRGYQDPLLLKSYERVIAALRETPALAAQFNVRYALQGEHFIHGWDRHFLPPPAELLETPGAEARGEGVVELMRALPLVYFAHRNVVSHVGSRPEALAELRRVAPARVAILDGAVDSRLGTPEPPIFGVDAAPARGGRIDSLRHIHYGRDALSFTIDVRQSGMLVINEAWYPGWEAHVDDERVPIYRANALVRAIAVGPGTHEVEMVFRPQDGVRWRWVLLCTLLACLLVLFGVVGRAVAAGRGAR